MKRIVVYVSPQVEPLASRAIEKVLREKPPIDVPESERLAFHHRSADVPSRPVKGASLVAATPAALKRAKAIYEDIEVDVEEVDPEGLAETDLAEGFPGRKLLRKDGRYAMEADLREATRKERDDVDGIGPATLDDIAEALGETSEGGDEAEGGEGDDSEEGAPEEDASAEDDSADDDSSSTEDEK